MAARVHVKICGVTTVGDARIAVACGASAIGLILVPTSPRAVTREQARRITAAIGDAALVVAVVADLALDDVTALLRDTGARCVQLHGDEPRDLVARLLPHAYKAVRVATAEDAARLATYPGDHLLADAPRNAGAPFDWSLVADLARTRKLTLAGALTPDNVGRAIAEVHPYCVDVASGVEDAPGKKSHAKIEAFIRAARS